MRKWIAVVLLLPAMARAEFFTGNQLLDRLQGSISDQIQALGYIQGVFDTMQGVVICAPNTINAGQVNDMIKNYLINSPAIRHNTADRIIGQALKGAWPCQDRGRSL